MQSRVSTSVGGPGTPERGGREGERPAPLWGRMERTGCRNPPFLPATGSALPAEVQPAGSWVSYRGPHGEPGAYLPPLVRRLLRHGLSRLRHALGLVRPRGCGLRGAGLGRLRRCRSPGGLGRGRAFRGRGRGRPTPQQQPSEQQCQRCGQRGQRGQQFGRRLHRAAAAECPPAGTPREPAAPRHKATPRGGVPPTTPPGALRVPWSPDLGRLQSTSRWLMLWGTGSAHAC